tara:strand:- start:143619 stop:144047 length:429 start_codon:yes stop_codon:yes gene_type:complete
MDTKEYICHYCHEKYIPKRRYAQKYCSNNCRSKAHHIKTKLPKSSLLAKIAKNQDKTSIEKMSLAGVGNAAAGSLLADGVKHIITTNQNLPATKGDLKNLENKFLRYHNITNMAPQQNGALPYFDMQKNQVVYYLGNPNIKK